MASCAVYELIDSNFYFFLSIFFFFILFFLLFFFFAFNRHAKSYSSEK